MAGSMSTDIRKRLFLAGIILLFVTLAGTAGYYLLGKLAVNHPSWSLSECFYMTIITLTTVGFGEVIDLSIVPGARFFTVFVLFGGLGVAAYFVSTLTAFLVEGELTHVFWRKKMEKLIHKLSNHVIVCGADRIGTGHYVIKELLQTRVPFVLIEKDQELIWNLQERFGDFPALTGDPTQALDLQSAGVEKAKGVISALDDDKDNLCVVVTCKQLNPLIKLIVSCNDIEFVGKLELLGAEVVMPSSIGGLRIASKMIRPQVVNYLDLMLRDPDSVVRIEDITLSDKSSLIGKSVGDIDRRAFNRMLVLAVISQDSASPLYNPDSSITLNAGDTMILQGDVDSLDRFRTSLA